MTDLLLIAPYDGGHHAEHVRWITTAAADRDLTVVLAASPRLLAGSSEVQALASPRITIHPLKACLDPDPSDSLLGRMRTTRRILSEAAERGRARRAFLTYLDAAVPALALPSREPIPERLSGLLFRPPFRAADPHAGRLRLAARQAVLWRAATSSVEPVFTLDPDVVPELNRLGARAVSLPDPVEPVTASRSRSVVRTTYGVEPGRILAVLFGSLEERKGIFALTQAIRRLPDAVAQRLAVVVAGRTYDAVRARLTSALDDVHRHTSAQVIFRETFLPDADLADLTAAADLVLAPYIGHVGSSGVVVRAAAAGTPLLTQADGQVGREVRGHRLGRTVDPSDIDALAAALTRCVQEPREGFDPAAAEAYARAHSVDRFTRTLFDALFTPSPSGS